MFTSSRKLFGSIPLTRYERIEKYLENLEQNIKITSKKDLDIVEDIQDLIDVRIKSLKKLNLILGFLYFGVYFGFISFLFTDIFFLSEFASLFSKILGFFGTTMFIIGIFFVNKLRELYYGDLNLLTAHLISIYNKVGFKDPNEVFGEKNNYGAFLNFFKKRL